MDLIERQAAIEIIQSMYPGMPRVPWMRKDWQKRYEPYIRTENAIRKLPSAQPEHNTGKWVRGTSHGLGVYNWTCKCGHVVVAKVPDRFCGACGCDNAERRTDE